LGCAPRHPQGKILAFFTGFIVYNGDRNNFFLFAGVEHQRCGLGHIITTCFSGAIEGAVVQLGDLCGGFVQAHSELNTAGIFHLAGAHDFGGVIERVNKQVERV